MKMEMFMFNVIKFLNHMEKVTYLNFKSMEVTGATKQEALSNAPFNVLYDATQAYRHWKEKQTTVTEAGRKQFMLDYLKTKTKNAAGVGCSITIESAVADKKERPYKIIDVKNEQGKRKYRKTYLIKDDKTGEVLAKSDETKAKAKEITKELYRNGYKGDAICTYTKEVVEGEPIAFYAKYSPSKSTKPGVYLVFGIES